jgi:DNA-binding transcriptional ArsR family regulator
MGRKLKSMEHEEIARIAALVGDNTRSRALLALMDGRALPAGELAQITNVSAATMSAHLSRLVEGGLLKVEVQGKHHYFRLSGPKVATLLETFGTLVKLPEVAAPTTKVPGDMRYARTCYRHLAGYVAVELNHAAQQRRLWVRSKSKDKQYEITGAGKQWLGSLGIDADRIRRAEGFARACLDWSERRHHLAGELGSMLLDRFLELKWMARIEGTRAVRVTHRGAEELSRRVGIRVA